MAVLRSRGYTAENQIQLLVASSETGDGQNALQQLLLLVFWFSPAQSKFHQHFALS
jgi:hypothetical protein